MKKNNSLKIPVILDHVEGDVDRAILPQKAHSSDAGFDIYSPITKTVPPRGSIFVDTGVRVLIPDGYVGFLKSKSGLNVKAGITTEGVIDAGYTGTIGVLVRNNSDRPYEVSYGDKITQLVILPIPEIELQVVDDFETTTDRGTGGFGSTGKK